MKTIFAAPLLALALAATAAADTAPIRWHGEGQSVLIYAGKKPIALAVGDNVLGQPHRFGCRAPAGCVVIVNHTAMVTDTIGVKLCTDIDGDVGLPGCAGLPFATGGTDTLLGHAQIRVGPGPHAIRTIVHSDNARGTVDDWSVDYTIYDRADPPR